MDASANPASQGADQVARAAPQSPSATPSAGRLPLVVTVGFTGHRVIEDEPATQALIDRTFDVLRATLDALLALPLHAASGPDRWEGPAGVDPPDDESLGQAYEGTPRLRLLSGDAPGADRLAIARWQAASLGETHRIYPFRDPGTDNALTDRPERASDETRVTPPADACWTGLDANGLGLPHDQAHGEVTQWIIRHADLLMAVWDGEQFEKPGGTGDTLRRALDRGLPAIWLQPGQPAPRLVSPAVLHHQGGMPDTAEELAACSEALTPAALSALLKTALAPPKVGPKGRRDPELMARQDYAEVNPLTPRSPLINWWRALEDRTVWRAYRIFERVAGGAEARQRTSESVDPPASAKDQRGFAVLGAAVREASGRANHLAAIHRSQQLLLILIATAAVVYGALPAMMMGVSWAHPTFALLELGLGFIAFSIHLGARRAHRHRRWSDARRLTERLRAARATWPLGVDIGDHLVSDPHTWTEWRAEAVLRDAGPRCGWLDAATFAEAVEWVDSSLIDSQIAYHDRQKDVASNIEDFLRNVEEGSFFVLMAVLAVYLGITAYEAIAHWHAPGWLSGLVILVSAVSPAVGAACLALEATSGFGELALRSERMAQEFGDLKAQLTHGLGVGYRHKLDVARRSAQLLVEDADAWRDRVARRRIVRS